MLCEEKIIASHAFRMSEIPTYQIDHEPLLVVSTDRRIGITHNRLDLDQNGSEQIGTDQNG